MSELTCLPAREMAQLICRKEVSPVDLVEAHLTRIEKLNPKVNAFVQVDAKRARQQARAAEQAVMIGDPLGPLHGVPISLKSSIAVAGLRYEAGTRLRAGSGSSVPLYGSRQQWHAAAKCPRQRSSR